MAREVRFPQNGEDPRWLPRATVGPQYSGGGSGHDAGVWFPVLPDFVAPLREVIKILVVLWINQIPNVSGHFPEPVFVNLLRSPGIDSQPGGPVR